MSYEVTGKLIAKYDTVERTPTFKTREFVLEHTQQISGRDITNYIKMQCVQDRTTMVDRFNIGDMVKVFFNLRGSKWSRDGKENYITNLDAWRMESGAAQDGAGAPPTMDAVPFDNETNPPAVDDLPF